MRFARYGCADGCNADGCVHGLKPFHIVILSHLLLVVQAREESRVEPWRESREEPERVPLILRLTHSRQANICCRCTALLCVVSSCGWYCLTMGN